MSVQSSIKKTIEIYEENHLGADFNDNYNFDWGKINQSLIYVKVKAISDDQQKYFIVWVWYTLKNILKNFRIKQKKNLKYSTIRLWISFRTKFIWLVTPHVDGTKTLQVFFTSDFTIYKFLSKVSVLLKINILPILTWNHGCGWPIQWCRRRRNHWQWGQKH